MGIVAEIVNVLEKTPAGVLILIVICCVGAVGVLLRWTIYLVKKTGESILTELQKDIKNIESKSEFIVTTIELLTIEGKATNNVLTDLFNGDFKSRYQKEKDGLIEDAKFLRNQS
jgi:NADH:ubiquinone oxidoreductase subunit 6 (subunit J)